MSALPARFTHGGYVSVDCTPLMFAQERFQDGDFYAPETYLDGARRTLDDMHRVHDDRFPVSLCHTCRPVLLALDMWDA